MSFSEYLEIIYNIFFLNFFVEDRGVSQVMHADVHVSLCPDSVFS
jgi:hypothetical protein